MLLHRLKPSVETFCLQGIDYCKPDGARHLDTLYGLNKKSC